jgi:adenine C2-methylase RlmN of 23S rRNA A2503 and tRNA A37
LQGVNDSVEQALALAKLLYKFNVAGHVNLIPYNTVDEVGSTSNIPTCRTVIYD